MRHIKITTTPVIVGALGMIKKAADKHINKIQAETVRNTKKMHGVELLLSSGEYYQCDWKISPKRNSKSIST